jgi:uncharacterized membrane protein HdeD (DUF308 family)
LSAVVVGWGAVCGAIELACGIRLRRHPASGDWIVVGALTVLLAVAVASVPLGFSDDFIGEQRVAGTLTASIVIVGVLGAYAAIVAVFSVIAGISARSRPEPGAGPPVEAGRMPS